MIPKSREEMIELREYCNNSKCKTNSCEHINDCWVSKQFDAWCKGSNIEEFPCIWSDADIDKVFPNE